MGWPSCFENDIERAHDRRFMMGLVEDRFRHVPAVTPLLLPRPIAKPPLRSATEQARIIQANRNIHILCLSELRPKAPVREIELSVQF